MTLAARGLAALAVLATLAGLGFALCGATHPEAANRFAFDGRTCIAAQGPALPAARLLASRLEERGFAAKLAAEAGDCTLTIAMAAAPGLGEGYTIARGTHHGAQITIGAAMPRGFVYAAGWLLSHLDKDHLTLDAPVRAEPALAVRGDQIGIRAKNNSFDAWTPAMLARHVDDLALLGANRIQLIGPVSDDAAASPLAPVPALDAILATARHAHEIGLEVALFQPLLRDYTKASDMAAEEADMAALAARFPALDAVYFPGGDPGHTAPEVLFRLLPRLAETVRAKFPKAEILVSSQGFDAAGFDAFLGEVRKRPKWLSAVFVGPQTRATIAEHRARIGAAVPLELYPDTAHAMHAQMPVMDWSPAFAFTQGREPVNPRPAAMARAFAQQTPGARGFIAYSEGVNDDWNVAQWLALAWDPARSPSDIALGYARLFIGDDRFVAVPEALEAGWRGDPASNRDIPATLRWVEDLSPAPWADWRIDLYRYRAVYDALVARRWKAAQAADTAARGALAQAGRIGAQEAAARAEAIYAQAPHAPTLALAARLDRLGDRLFARARLQLSVERHGASNWERGANLDRAMTTLSDRTAIQAGIAAGLALPDEAARAQALERLADRADRAGKAYYDDLGQPGRQPHLVTGKGSQADVQGRLGAIDGIADRLPEHGWHLSELTYAESLYERPLELLYTDLPQKAAWCLRYTWAGEGYARAIEVRAGGEVVQAFHPRTGNPAFEQVAIPRRLVQRGRLRVAFTATPGLGGSGRGQQIAEAWLVPLPSVECQGDWKGPDAPAR
ncbi:hypothetical protein HT136_06145 [Novosphingobium profundi]|uniref:hypothetical protein n=1 Tax=Novosphingobium profundi TaxID=1774954 RepID=UPI001BDB1B3D|nr:hypothetical protein [Novosphingobium profundi]MBT0667945.1 hypothetical protein [Novosphingobium profundi]